MLKPLGNVRFNQGSLLAQVRELGFDIQQTARADVLVEDALKTSAIEGEKLDPDAVRSSVGRQLGLPDAGLNYVQDQKAGFLPLSYEWWHFNGMPKDEARNKYKIIE